MTDDMPQEPTEHDLKCWPEYFRDVERGDKPFDLRKDDRDYQPYDTLRLREWDPRAKDYTGRECRREITYVLRGPLPWGLAEGFAILGLASYETEAIRLLRYRQRLEAATFYLVGKTTDPEATKALAAVLFVMSSLKCDAEYVRDCRRPTLTAPMGTER